MAHTIHGIVETSLLAISRFPLYKVGVLPRELPMHRPIIELISLVIPIDVLDLPDFELLPPAL
jgi:hypothetical protein